MPQRDPNSDYGFLPIKREPKPLRAGTTKTQQAEEVTQDEIIDALIALSQHWIGRYFGRVADDDPEKTGHGYALSSLERIVQGDRDVIRDFLPQQSRQGR